MSYQVAIPSYARAELLPTTTLPLLANRGVPMNRVTVFVADESERQAYARALGAFGGEIVVAVPGMGAVRNFIAGHYPPGSALVQIDDDVRDVYRKVGEKGAAPVEDLDRLFRENFAALNAAELTLWGVYAVDNPFFMKHTASTDLKYIVGALWGVINSHGDHCQVTLDDKEDFERTIKHYLYAGGVLRFNDIGIKTRYYSQPGGMQVTRTEERVERSARLLNARYPELAHLNFKKASGHVEIRLRDKRAAAGTRGRAAAVAR